MLHNIPAELRELDQWVVSGPDKVPLNPRTGRKASPTDPATWGTFEEACVCGYKHVGFVLAETDPFTIIDLDNKPSDPATAEQLARFEAIIEAAESYTEISTSGQGVHIIVKGSIPRGIKRDKVEMYSSGRYMICTGDVIRQMPIVDRQELLDALFVEMDSETKQAELREEAETLTDEELLEMAGEAQNGHKFAQLWEGNWQADWPSQSEADFALMSMLAFYSRSNEQCRRVFRQSALGKRDKAKRDAYLNAILAKMRAKEPPLVDLSKLKLCNYEKESGRTEAASLDRDIEMGGNQNTEEEKESDDSSGSKARLPSGLVGELADYIFASAIRPVREYSLAASIACIAGICGRSFNISGLGLNQFIVVIGSTGSGKEGISRGLDYVFQSIRKQVINADGFLGPASFASGPALVRALSKQPCFVSVMGEIGFLIQNLTDPKANEASKSLLRALLDIYTKSGPGRVLQSSVYSQTERNTASVASPCPTIIGDSTADVFYRPLSQENIASGFLSRFTIFEYEGPRVPSNENFGVPPSEHLTNCVAELANIALSFQQAHQHCPVPVDSSARRLLKDFDAYADEQINGHNGEISKQLWNRAHLKALKLAALCAVGQNPVQPEVTLDCAEWACELVHGDVSKLLEKFDRGEVGAGGEVKQDADLRRAIADWGRMKRQARLAYKINEKVASSPVVPFSYLRKRLTGLQAFASDRRGASKAVEEALKRLVMDGELKMLPPVQAKAHYATTQPLYLLSD